MVKKKGFTHGYRALGIDPGLAATGYAVIETQNKAGKLLAWGCVKTSAKDSLPGRLQNIYDSVAGLIKQWNPVIFVMEDVFVVDRFPKAALQLGEVRGVLYLAAEGNKIETMKIRPTEVKSCLTGYGRATKIQVAIAVKRILGEKKEIKPDHASDAAALALIGLSRKGYYVW
jgi:crossover junction endodeoxyribonuclease RuvC